MEEDEKTKIEDLTRLVSEKNAVTPREAANALEVDEKEVLDLSKILESQGIIKRKYTVLGDITFEKGETIKNASAEELDKQIKQTLAIEEENENKENATAAEILSEIRDRIRQARLNKSEDDAAECEGKQETESEAGGGREPAGEGENNQDSSGRAESENDSWL